MMPRGTPLMSFTEGTVTRIKQRDGSTKNEGNCVVITTPDNHAVCYEHLETINVEMGQLVDASTMIGRCGTTGNSTQYHLHLQIDTQQAPFHPYRDANPVHLYTYTVAPLAYLRNRSPIVPFFDLPFDLQEQQAILWLTRQ